MPKESTHLYLAQKVADEIKNSAGKYYMPGMAGILDTAPHLFKIGSVAPDSILNYINGKAKSFLGNFVKYSHDCMNHHLFDFFRRFADAELPFIPALSLGIGTICHLTADMIFHPAVFYFTGSDGANEKRAMIRHFSFESELDRMLRWICPELRRESLGRHLKMMELSRHDLAAALKAIHMPENESGLLPSSEMLSMIRQHSKHESMYGRPFYSNLSRLLNLISGNRFRELPALMYTDRSGKATAGDKKGFIEKRIEYRNPVSGAAFNKSFMELEKDFKDLFLEFLMPIEKILHNCGGPEKTGWRDIIPAVNQITPKNPDSGLPCFRDSETNNKMQSMTEFSIRTFEEVWI